MYSYRFFGSRRFALVSVVLTSLSLPACTGGVPGKATAAAATTKAVQVQALPAEFKELRRNVQAVGSLFAQEEVTVSSEVEGKVDSVLVDVGDRVEAGQSIVKVSTIELTLALQQQRALYQQARARLGLTGSSDDLANVTDAAEVKKAAADLKETEGVYQRARLLLDKQVLPKQDFDETEAKVNSARAAYDLAVQNVQNLRAQLPQYKAAVDLAEKKVRDAEIRAPFKGQIKERLVGPGQYLRVQTPVVVIVSVDPLRMRLKIPEKMTEWIKLGDRIAVSVDAYPDKKFSGTVSRINPAVDQQSRTFEVEASLENSAGLLKPGFFVQADMPTGKVDRAFLVPEDALEYSYGVYKVFLIQGNALKETEVKVGERSNDQIEVVSGLKEGDMIALAATGQVLKDGEEVQVAR
jgi:multidrug efflux pump subunit AcrA (membrane-fusion protein)